MSNVPDRTVFEAAYAGQAPWDIGRPQQAFIGVADRITGSILDCGCGTGENALYFAGRGHKVTGIDFLAEPINRAKRKAAERGLTATFLVMDALALKDLPEVFDSVIDSGLFQVFNDDDRRRYVEGLAAAIKPGDATHFVLGHHWKTHFSKKAAETGSALTVGQLRKWIDDPKAMGLPKEAENLVLLVFAAQTNRTFYLHGAPCDATLSSIPDSCELRQQKLPDLAQWELAVQRAGSIFGQPVSRLLNASNVNILTAGVKQRADERRPGCQSYCRQLRDRLTNLGLKPDTTDRMKTASATLAIIERIQNADVGDVVERLATSAVATSETAMLECFGKAAEWEGNLETANWEIFEAVSKLADDRQATAAEILTEVRQALSSDEHVIQLAPALKGAQAKAVRLLTKAAPPPPLPPPTPPPLSPPPPGIRVVSRGSEQNLNLAAAKELLSRLSDEVKSGQSIRLKVDWSIEEGGKGS